MRSHLNQYVGFHTATAALVVMAAHVVAVACEAVGARVVVAVTTVPTIIALIMTKQEALLIVHFLIVLTVTAHAHNSAPVPSMTVHL